MEISRAGRARKAVNYKEKGENVAGQAIAIKEDEVEKCEEDAHGAIAPEAKIFR